MNNKAEQQTSLPRLILHDIKKKFGATQALRGVSLSVDAGTIHALIGVNGAGKSTLMRILSGAERADSGGIQIDSRPFDAPTPLSARQAGIAMIYQELALAGHLSVAENILLGIEPAKAGVIKRKDMLKIAETALEKMGHADIPLNARLSSLGIAQRQVVEIARALAAGCRILVLDEPTSSLPQADIQNLFKVLNRLRDQGIAVIYISHIMEEIKTISDNFTVLRDGMTAGQGKTADTGTEKLLQLMSGVRKSTTFKRSARNSGEVLLSCETVSGLKLPHTATFELKRGEVLGLAGAVGSGRTELLRILMGLDPLRSGKIKINGTEGRHDPATRLQQGIGMLCEDRKTEGLALNLSIADNITLSFLKGCGKGGIILPSIQARHAARFIDLLDIKTTGPNRPVKTLSGGNQQKVAIARLLFQDCDILLLDEPTRGVDAGSRQQIYALIDSLAAAGTNERPRAVLMASSYLPELLDVCDRIAVMHKGKLGPARPAGEWTEHELLKHATGGWNGI